MTIDGDVLEIELDMDLGEVMELKKFVEPRLEYIESIEIVGEREVFTSSSLFALLFSIKKSKPEIRIPLIDEGVLKLAHYGSVHWIYHD
jgi:hypothetical protein